MCMSGAQRPEKGAGSHGTGVTDVSCRVGAGETGFRPLEEELVLLTAESSL